MLHNLEDPLAILLAQIVTIIIVARLFGWIFKKIGQPTVIGEIIAGIVLGPSLVGMYFPEFSAALFPDASLGNLKFLSQIGLILFMYVIGMELDIKVLTDPQIHKIVLSMASFIHNGFQHSLQELTYIQLSYFPRYNLLDRSCLVYCVA